MSLDALAENIASSAQKEVDAIIAEAEAEASKINEEAKIESAKVMEGVISKAEKEATLIETELAASAKQSIQKDILISKRKELDETWTALLEIVGSAKLPNRGKMLKSLLSEAKKVSTKDMVLRPVGIDRKVLEKEAKDFKIGSDIDGLGGFTLESGDGTISLDFRFKSRLESTWNEKLGEIRDCLFS